MAAEENKVQTGSNSAETGKLDGDVSGNAEGPAAIVPESEKQAAAIARMKELADSIEKAGDDNTCCTRYDIELHKLIAESSGNVAISTVLPVIRSNMEYFNSLDFEREWGAVNAGHRAIIAAIEMHNPMLAEAEMVKHLSYVTEKMDKKKEKAISDAFHKQ